MITPDKSYVAGASSNRRTFLTRAGLLTAAASGALLAACGTTPSSSSAGSTAGGEKPAPSPSGGTATSSSSLSGSVLVAYYSAQGHTKAVAERIASGLGAALFEMRPQNPYSTDDLNWNDPESRIVQEYEDTSKRTIELAQAAPDDFSQYRTVLLGYPIWWQDTAWPVNGFITGNDFTGKDIHPFCTSLSSGLGQSSSNLEKMAGTGTWHEGHRFPERPDNGEIDQWVASLGLQS